MEQIRIYKNSNDQKTFIKGQWYKALYESGLRYFKFDRLEPDYKKNGTSADDSFYCEFIIMGNKEVKMNGEITNGNIEYSAIAVDEKDVLYFLLTGA